MREICSYIYENVEPCDYNPSTYGNSLLVTFLTAFLQVSAEGENTSQNTEGMAEELANLVKSYSSLNPNDKKHIADIVTNKWGEFFTLTQGTICYMTR